MPKWAKWILWVVIAVILLRIISNDPHGAGNSVGKFLSGFWTFLGSI